MGGQILTHSSPENPYQTPASDTSATPISQADALRAIDHPASILIALSALTALCYAVFFAINFVGWVNTQDPSRSANSMLFGALLCFHIAGTVAFARVRGCKGYYRGLIYAILAAVPGLSSCIIVGMPFGIWLAVVLLQPGMYAAFKRNTDSNN